MALLAAAAVAAVAPACKRPAEAAKDALGEAGYQHTPEDWLRATREDNVAVMKRFLAAGFAADTRDANGDSALHTAAGAGAQKAAEFLLNKGLPVDQRGARERTPLMVAVMANQPKIARWLLRQGASAKLKDADGYSPLMLAVRENATKTVGELAAQTRDELDAALLAAALEGRAEMIDSLTKYGASVYARMEDGRTSLMLAAQNNHEAAVRMLLDLGCGRFAVTPEGQTAADLAAAEGHQQVAAMILAKPVADELVLETPETVAGEMTAMVDAAEAGEPAPDEAGTEIARADGGNVGVAPDSINKAEHAAGRREPVVAITGRTLATAPKAAAGGAPPEPGKPTAGENTGVDLIMRHYRQREMPVAVKTVAGDTATLRISGAQPREVQVRTGETVPGTRLVVVGFHRRMAIPKDGLEPQELSAVELKDAATGATREILTGLPAGAHDPVALVEDARTGRRYTATPGQRFTDSDGRAYRVADVRPNQIIIEDTTNGNVRTLPLRGPRG